MEKKQSGIELFRIFCMLCIIGAHYLGHTCGDSVDLLYRPFQLHQLPLTAFGIWGQLGAGGFIFITSWYMQGKNIHIDKVFWLVVKAWSYSVCFLLIGILPGLPGINIKTAVRELLTPIGCHQYWFITSYCMFYMLLPFLNLLLRCLSKSGLKSFCIILSLMIPFYSLLFRGFDDIGGGLAYFITIFYVTAFVKKYCRTKLEKYAGRGAILLTVGLICFVTLGNIISVEIGSKELFQIIQRLRARTIFIMLDSLMLFLWFKKLNLKENKVINLLGGGYWEYTCFTRI